VRVTKIKNKEIFNPDDKVHVDSIAKTILAVGILHLATERKIDLEESISTSVFHQFDNMS
jgi:hypothetical protein